MRRKTTQVMILSLLLTGAAAAFGGYAYAADDDVTVSGPARAVVPYKPTNLSAVVGDLNDDGTANVTLTFTTPSKGWDEDEYETSDDLETITKIAVYDWNVDKKTAIAEVTEDIELGAEMTIVLENQSSGSHTYRVFALNDDSYETVSYNYYSYAYVTVKVGYDAPGSVSDLAVVNNNPEITLTWGAPTTGKEGGIFRTEGLTYNIYRYTGSNLKQSEKIASGVTELTYTDNVSYSSPTQIAYGVSAVNEDGESDITKTSGIIVGDGYSIPFSETFKGGTATNLWTSYKSITEFSVASYISSRGISTGFGSSLKDGYDGDSGALYIKCNSDYYDSDEEAVATYGTYTSAAISLKDAKRPALSFYQYVVPNAKNALKASIIVETGGEQKTIAEYTFTEDGEEGWVARSIDLSEFNDKDIVVIFRGDCTNDQPGFTAFDVITIEEATDYDLVLNNFTATSDVDAGKEFTAAVEVYNKGSKAAENFDVELYVDGNLFKSETVESLASGESTTVTFKATADNTYNEKTVLSAKVVLEADEDQSNNESSKLTLNVTKADAPAVTDLEAKQEENNIALSWSEPDYILPAATEVTESFENYNDGDKTFGDWTTSDAHSYGISFDKYGLDEDQYSGSATFTVSDQEEDDWYGKAATGDKYIFKTNNTTDYLISPILSGDAQTISFKIATRHQSQIYEDGYNESTRNDVVAVYYSTTTNAKSALTNKVISTEITSILKNGDDYQDVSADLPEGAKYFAIVVSGPTLSGWDEYDTKPIIFIDDITFVQGAAGIQAELLGYNVFDGETKLNEELVTETSYTVESAENGEHLYTVVAVYNVGESEASNVASVSKSGVANITASGVSVIGGVGEININASAANVFDIAGRRVAATSGNSVVRVAKGTYIVRADNRTFKVLVK